MGFFSGLDKVLLIFFIVVLGTIFAFSFNVDVTKPYHDARQMAIGNESILSDNNALLAKYGGTGLISCKDGNIIYWNDAVKSWACGKNLMSITDANNIVVSSSGGTGLVSCLDGNLLKWSSTANGWVCGGNLISSGGGTTLPSCSNGEVLKWNGTAWACGTDNTGSGGITQLSAGTGIALTPNPITSTGTIAVNTTNIQARVTGTCPAGQAVSLVNSDGTVTCTTVQPSYCYSNGKSYTIGATCGVGGICNAFNTPIYPIVYCYRQTCQAGGVWSEWQSPGTINGCGVSGNGAAVYSCPAKQVSANFCGLNYGELYGHGANAIWCNGQLSFKSTCWYFAAGSCANEVSAACTIVGYLANN